MFTKKQHFSIAEFEVIIIKKKKNKLLFLAIIIVSLFIILIFLKSQLNSNKNNETKMEEINNNYHNSIEDCLKEQYGNNYKEIVNKNAKAVKLATQFDLKYINAIGNKEYPSSFGGMYINDYGDLIICLVKNSNDIDYILEIISNISNEIKIKYVTNSYIDLQHLKIQIEKFAQNNKSIKNYISCHIDIINNVVEIKLKNNLKAEQDLFKSVFNPDQIRFIKGDHSINYTE